MRWLRRLFGKSRAENELDRELRFHLEQQVSENLAGGMPVEEARRDALIKLGGLERVKEEVRDTRWVTHIDNIIRDFRFALRSLRKDRRFAFIAIFALALGIGATSVMFSVVYNVLLDPLPYKSVNRSVVIRLENLANAGGWKGRNNFSPPEVTAFREQNHVFEDLVAYEQSSVIYDDGKSRRALNGMSVTTNTFEYLGVPPLLGRALIPVDGTPAAPLVFVMNYRLWQTEFGGDAKILGTTFFLNDKPRTLVGIMPPRFNAYGASVWLPVSPDEGWLALMGRLKPGVSVQAAAADLDAIAHRLQRLNPGEKETYPEKFAIEARTLLDSLIGDFKRTLYALLAAVLMLLLIACSNVANLLMARATAREREMAMRATLGATRTRLIRQLLVESFVLAAAASLVGCALAYSSLRVVQALIPAGMIPEETLIRMNAPVLFLSLGITVIVTFLCGLAPAFYVVRGDLQPRFAGSGNGCGDHSRRGKLRAGLVITEVALSIVLLIAAGLVMRSFLILTRVDLGFNPRNILYFRLSLPTTYDHSREKQNMLTHQLLDRLRALPGVTSVAETMLQPPLTYDWSETIIPGKPHAERWETRYGICSAGYFQTLGLPLLRGRFFSEDDVNAQRYLMVVSQMFARQYFLAEDPLGQKVKLQVLDRPFLDAPHDTYFEIVGVVGDYKTRGYEVPSWQSFPQAFIPYSVQGFSWRTYMVRTAVDPNSLLQSIGKEVRAVDPSVGITTSGTLEGSLQDFYRGPQFELVTFTAFAAIGLVLVVIGVFSVMAYTVSLQTHEIGIRLALGAKQRNILLFALIRGFRLIAAGILTGLAASLAFTRFLSSQLSGVSPTDPWTFAVAVTIVVFVGMAACVIPARRAANVDPLVALRYE